MGCQPMTHHGVDIILGIAHCVCGAGFLDCLVRHLEYNDKVRNTQVWSSQRFDALSDPVDLLFARQQQLRDASTHTQGC
jgi:hypothetical protein